MSRLQRQFYRNGPNYRAGAEVSFADIVKLFDFQQIKIGRWVTAAEQQIAAPLFFDALCDLQTILQVPPQVISCNGSLSLSFGIGGQPDSCAFYQPKGRLLALAKNAGGGSLAHEWFHAFDHYIATRMFRGAGAHDFASRCWLLAQDISKPVLAIQAAPLAPKGAATPTPDPLSVAMTTNAAASTTTAVQKAIQPTNLSSTLQSIKHPLNQRLDAAFMALFLSGQGNSPSAYFVQSKQADWHRRQLYYALPEEMAARAFEHALEQQPLKNQFLVHGCLSGPAVKAGIYPDAVLSARLAEYWLDYFYWLGQALQHKASSA